MANAQLKKVLLIASAAITVMFVVQGIKASNILNDKAQAQAAETDTIARWKQSYQALGGARQKWDASFRKVDSVPDIVGLASHIDLAKYGLETDGDNMVLSKIEPMLQSGQPLGLTKICLATGSANGGGFLVAAQNYEALLVGIEKLSKRLDITMGNISLQGDKAFPVAALGDFCVLLRN